MEVILLKDVSNIGRKGEVVKVRDGYGRNFLIPRNLGMPSSKAGVKFVADQKARAEKRRVQEKSQAEAKAKELEKLKLTIDATAGEQDKLFGAITAEEIRIALAAKGFEIRKKHVLLKEPIKSLGTHSVTVEVFPQVKSTVTVEVLRKS